MASPSSRIYGQDSSAAADGRTTPPAAGVAGTAPPGPVHSLSVVNNLAELRRMSEWLVQAARSFALPPERISELELCANEAVTNVISYAYDRPERHTIALRLRRAADGVSLEIEDDGRPFDPLSATLPAAPASLDDAKIGGAGLKLIRGMMAACHYQRRNDKNILTLTVRS